MSQTVNGTTGDDLLYGGDEDDFLNGLSGHDTLYGGKGDDLLDGGENDDTYVFARGDGADTIEDRSSNFGGFLNDHNIIQFTDINPGDIDFVKLSGWDWVIGYGGQGDQITLWRAERNNQYGVQSVHFADGTTWGRSDLDALIVHEPIVVGTDNDDILIGTVRDDLISGHDGDDVLYGHAGQDILTGGNGSDSIYAGEGDDEVFGGQGSDLLIGHDGSDTYVFSRGDGYDVILDARQNEPSDRNIIRFTDINPEDIENVFIWEHSWVLDYGGQGDRIMLLDAEVNVDRGIDAIHFADGSIWDRSDLESLILPPTILGSEGDDLLTGTSQNDLIQGLGGHDHLHGGHAGGDDTLVGGHGDDSLHGGLGRDTFIGGPGNDAMVGDDINFEPTFVYGDTYVLARGDGVDRLLDIAYSDEKNVLQFVDINPSDIDFVVLDGFDWIVGYGGLGDQVQLSGAQWGEHYGVQTIIFADGTEWGHSDLDALILTLTLVGSEGSDEITGSARSDLLQGLEGDDLIDGFIGDDTIEGGANHDTLLGFSGDDVLHGDTGNDFLVGDIGSDTYLFKRGDGSDTLEDHSQWGADHNVLLFVDINPEDIDSLTTAGDDWILGYGGQGDEITLLDAAWDPTYGVQAIHFADGTVWERNHLEAIVSSWKVGTQGDDLLEGAWRDDLIQGLDGHDVLRGWTGNDTLMGGHGNDVLNGGAGIDWVWFGDTEHGIEVQLWRDRATQDGHGGTDTLIGVENIRGSVHDDWIAGDKRDNRLEGDAGHDTLRGGTGDDTLVGGAGNDSLNGGHGFDTADHSGASGAITVKLWKQRTEDDGEGGQDTLISIEHVIGSAFNDFIAGDQHANRLEGGAGNDTLRGGSGDDGLEGGEGDDLLVLGSGANLLLFDQASGRDTVMGFSANKGDRLLLKADINGSGLQSSADALAAASTQGSNVFIDLGGGHGITLLDFELKDLSADAFWVF